MFSDLRCMYTTDGLLPFVHYSIINDALATIFLIKHHLWINASSLTCKYTVEIWGIHIKPLVVRQILIMSCDIINKAETGIGQSFTDQKFLMGNLPKFFLLPNTHAIKLTRYINIIDTKHVNLTPCGLLSAEILQRIDLWKILRMCEIISAWQVYWLNGWVHIDFIENIYVLVSIMWQGACSHMYTDNFVFTRR